MGAVRWMEGNHAKERPGTNGNVRILLSLYTYYWMLSLLLRVYQLWKWSTEERTNYVKFTVSIYSCYEEFRNMLVSFIQGCYIVYLKMNQMVTQIWWFKRMVAAVTIPNYLHILADILYVGKITPVDAIQQISVHKMFCSYLLDSELFSG